MNDKQLQEAINGFSPLEKMTKAFQTVDELTPHDSGIHLHNTFQYATQGVHEILLDRLDATEGAIMQRLSNRIDELGLSSKIVTQDGVIQDYEFAQVIAKGGYMLLDGADVRLEDITEESYPEAFEKAREFGKENNIKLEGHDDITVGLVAFEILAKKELSDMLSKDLGLNTIAAELVPKLNKLNF